MQEFQIATVRPPTENFSLAISTHTACSWNKCHFCVASLLERTPQFQRRTLEESKSDIDNAAELNDYLLKSGELNQISMIKAISRYPTLQNCLIHLAYWHIYANATTAFLGGSNPLLYKSEFLSEVSTYMKDTFPSIKRITSYGRTRTAAKKGPEYFKILHDAGLDRIHVGLESGSDKVLEYVNKGATSEEHVKGGLNIKEGGISLCTYVMPGLGGKRWSTEHALETARVINEIEPDFVRLRTLEIFPGTPLQQKKKSGDFIELSEEEVVREERILIENITCNTIVTSDSAANLLIEIWGDFPRDKKNILNAIDDYLNLTPHEKMEFSLKRRVEAFRSQYGGLNQTIQRKLKRLSDMTNKDKYYYDKMEKVIKFIRSKLIP